MTLWSPDGRQPSKSCDLFFFFLTNLVRNLFQTVKHRWNSKINFTFLWCNHCVCYAVTKSECSFDRNLAFMVFGCILLKPSQTFVCYLKQTRINAVRCAFVAITSVLLVPWSSYKIWLLQYLLAPQLPWIPWHHFCILTSPVSSVRRV